MEIKEIRGQYRIQLSNGQIFYIKEVKETLEIRVDGYDKIITSESTGFSNAIRINQEDKY